MFFYNTLHVPLNEQTNIQNHLLYLALKKLSLYICESYAERYHSTYNPTKSKLICYNIDPST